nr:prepilin-type N-terminal cleavage/methylation domain-containing protein [Acidovorax sp.]
MVSTVTQRGFTLIELLVVLAVIATLLSLVAPQYMGSVDAAKEQVLRENLSTLRSTLDKFHADTGRYPESLDELVTARYLRRVPVDPLMDSNTAWVVISPPDKVKGVVFDVKSAAQGMARDGSAFGSW